MFDYPQSGMYNLKVSIHSNIYHPPVDVIETNDRFLIRVEIAGVKEKDFNIRFEQSTLIISGVRNDHMKNHSFHQMEIHYGEFLVEVRISQPVDRDSIKAEYQNGFLEVTITKAIPREIHIIDKDS